MKRTFLGTVTAINPTETSGFVPGCHAVSVRVDPVEMGRLTFTTAFHFPHDETRGLGALFGKSNAVRITVETVATTTRIPTRDTAQVGEYYEHNCKVYLRSPKGEAYDDLVAEAFGLDGLKGDAYEASCVERAQRIASLLNGACGEHAAVALLKEFVKIAENTEGSNTDALGRLLDFSERADVLAAAGYR